MIIFYSGTEGFDRENQFNFLLLHLNVMFTYEVLRRGPQTTAFARFRKETSDKLERRK